MAEQNTAEPAADHIADAVIKLGLCLPVGGALERRVNTEKGTVYYRIGFSTPTTVDGEINVYSDKWIYVWFASNIEGLSGERKAVFRNVSNAKAKVIDFLSKAFVTKNVQGALGVLPES